MIIEIEGIFYRIRYKDHGLWRADKVKRDRNGWWFCCDDDDYLIDDSGRIVAREVGWDLRREEI